MRKQLCLIAFFLVLLLVANGCSNNGSAIGSGDAAAIVNEEKILKSELDERTEQMAILYGYNLDDPNSPSLRSYLTQKIIDIMIDEKLIRQEAAKLEITVSQEDLEAEMKKIRDQFDTEEKYQQFLDERKFTNDELRGYVEDQLYMNALFEHITKDITAPSKDPKEYYEQNKAEFYAPERVKARHILVASKEDAEAAIKRLDNGEDMTKLAVELSTDPSVKENEGLVDYFTRDDQMITEGFRMAAFNLDIGEYTKEPVLTTFGYHVIKVEDKLPAKQYEYDEIKDVLSERLLLEERQAKYKEYMDKLKKDSKIENLIAKELEAQTKKPNNTSSEQNAPAEGK